ncbi:hypothetical protein [Peribacillus asahii]|uniref:hypothetical protein n=1 Tax=Peribacillus asahii TaxID=228899 RepID=UPI00207AC448|nr:hypothetical protein [Peribacillus asahii]USK71250.1 hypothetical protein LIS76_05660 [Peribacillus asahii]
MIDTMTTSYQLTKVGYDFLFTRINNLSIELSGQKLYRDRCDKNAYVTYALKELGYQEIKLRHVKFVNYRAIEIRVRPKLVIEKDNYYELIYPNEIEQFRKAFNDYMSEFYLPDLLKWNVKRIDYAIDLNISQDLIPIYMLLFKKSNIPYFALSNSITQKYMDSSTNLYLYSNNITINYYDRYRTLFNKQLENKKDWIDIEVVRNKLRLEVQNKNCKGQVIEYLNIDNYKKAIQTNYDLVIGSGDYYLLNESLDIIKKSITNLRKSIILRDFIKQIDKVGGVWKAKEKFVQGYVDKEREKRLKAFSNTLNKVRRIGINPVSLPEQCGLVKLSNLKLQINERISELERELVNLNDSMTSICEVL